MVAGCVVAAPLSPLSPPHPASRPADGECETVMRTGTLTGAPCDVGRRIRAMVEHNLGAYLDHAAATTIDPRVREAMAPFVDAHFGNPEGLHDWAREPADAIERARGEVAALVGAEPGGVIFTSGDTESRNLAVKGVAAANAHRGGHLVVSAIDHPATLAAARTVTRATGALTTVGVDGEGRIDPWRLADAVRDDTVLVNIVHGQPEIGTVQDVPALIGAVRGRRADVAIHVDAGATAGLLPVDAAAWDCDLVSLGGGSLLGPRWAGALWVREGTRLHPLIEGGLQEGGKRGGAHDVPAVVGLGAAARLARDELDARAAHMTALAERLIDRLLAVAGRPAQRAAPRPDPGPRPGVGRLGGGRDARAVARRTRRGGLAWVGLLGRGQGLAGAGGHRPGGAVDPLGGAVHPRAVLHRTRCRHRRRRVRRGGRDPPRDEPDRTVKIVDALGTWCPVPIHLVAPRDRGRSSRASRWRFSPTIR